MFPFAGDLVKVDGKRAVVLIWVSELKMYVHVEGEPAPRWMAFYDVEM